MVSMITALAKFTLLMLRIARADPAPFSLRRPLDEFLAAY